MGWADGIGRPVLRTTDSPECAAVIIRGNGYWKTSVFDSFESASGRTRGHGYDDLGEDSPFTRTPHQTSPLGWARRTGIEARAPGKYRDSMGNSISFTIFALDSR